MLTQFVLAHRLGRGVFAFGDATSQGSLPGVGVHLNNVVGAVPTG